MNSNKELKPGWLLTDLERASRRVQELKIAKSNFNEPIQEDTEETIAKNCYAEEHNLFCD
jgi:hypothetical protein